MLLHCEREGGASDEAALAAGWLRADTLDSLIELNELSLALLVEQSAASAASSDAPPSLSQCSSIVPPHRTNTTLIS